ncbi:nitrogenase molybdenum-iron protein beta chain [Butyrivibrio sp. ob235]|uniref:nitrogenase component 1 n=1 Tax=Butyrivibrio sp. ob235 TaxID=1761780 RepID=UPI0008BE1E8A|nr:nitrogenase component 1 [Butyrivibrio sp. ob235]SEL03691.1 nitrogenase molybdenum-iron protein beta chain [Butyrivibrio sp. ob235]
MSYIERPRSTCALGGALATIGDLPGVVAISHTPSGCAGNLSGATAFGSGNSGSGYCTGGSVPVSNVGESQVIFGGDKRLKEEIENALDIIDAELFVVTTGCMTEIIADDIQGVVKEFQEKKLPVTYVNTPSFEADAYKGYDIVMNEVLNRVIPVSSRKDKKLVNILGIVPQFDPFYRGDLEEIKRLLEKIGLKVNTFFTADQTYANVKSASKAALNIVFSEIRGISVAKKFQEKHGTPFIIENLPIGSEATDRFLKNIGKALNIDQKLINTVIREENSRYYTFLQRTTDYHGDGELKYYVDIAANGNQAIPFAEFIERELGWILENVVITDILSKKETDLLKKQYSAQGLKGKLLFETNTNDIEKQFVRSTLQSNGSYFQDTRTPVYLLGSTLDKNFGQKVADGSLFISYPVFNRVIVNKGYAGYNGGLNLFADIYESLVPGRL